MLNNTVYCHRDKNTPHVAAKALRVETIKFHSKRHFQCLIGPSMTYHRRQDFMYPSSSKRIGIQS